jgi:hypothetical protein
VKIRAAVVVSILIALPVFAQEVEKNEAAPSGASESVQTSAQAASQARPELRPVTNGTPDHLAKFDASGTPADSGIVETSDGKVGIGTATPSNALHVLINDGVTNAPLKLETSGVDSITGLSLKNDARNVLIRLDGADNDRFKIWDATANATRFSIDPTYGYVGIGTADPKAQLHVFGPATGDVIASIGTDPTNGPALNFGVAGLTPGYGRSAAFFNIRPDVLATAPNPSLRFLTANVERMIITNTGAVGIGTTTPAQKVHVFETADVQAMLLLQNSSAASNSSAAIRVQSDLAMTNLISHATGRTISRYGVVLGGWSELLAFQGNGLVMGTVSSTPVIIGTSNIDRIHVTGAGDVGIGIATPSAKLHVAGNIIATGSITGATVIGAVYQDVAEWVPAAEHFEPGTVVVVDKRTGNTVRASMTAYDTSVAGVVSAQPGIILGEGSASKEQVATTGRVRVRVDASKGAIQLGDLLVTSDIPGTAMKSEPIDVGGVSIHRPGTIIGKALEPLDRGEGEILVLLSLQ